MTATALTAGALAGCGSGASTTSRATSASPAPSSSPTTPSGNSTNGIAQLRSVWGAPTGGARPRALLLLIHGGGWKGRDTTSYQSMVAIAPIYQRLGYETLTFDYRGGAQSVQDAEMFYRLARKRVGPRLPICALGPSAGGHIALMLAVMNADLACVVDLAGPTDLVSLARQPGGADGYALAVSAFGKANLATYSPALHAGSIRAKVMLVYAQNDPIVPVAQGREMARALAGAQLLVLPPGPVSFVHSIGGPGTTSGVSAAADDRAQAAGTAFLAAAARP